jgi:hypothetical protein
MAVNWSIIGQDVRAHPKAWVALLIACVPMQPVMLWYGGLGCGAANSPN